MARVATAPRGAAAAARASALGRRRSYEGSPGGVPTGTLSPGLHQNPVEHARLEDLDRPLLGVDHGYDVAALHDVAWLLQPFDQGAGFHVGAERWHDEFAQAGLTKLCAAAAIIAGCGSAACSRCAA